MVLTQIQRIDLQDDTAIGSDQAVFTDLELERIWTRVIGAPDEVLRHEAALALIFRQLLADANKLHNYKAGATAHELKVIRANLKEMYDLYEPALQAALSRKTQIARNTLRSQPHQTRRLPFNDHRRDHRNNTLDDAGL